ncbi:ion transporter [Noviherbaspirillum pedocola]|uniref:Ion transporter n=1 Tax=Noviherbaspirillum pedocola TaxID=2801341 RepID=A0A934SZT3_9BURK|nr:ion transporter [Noviherbaspirillum pedocola]MBK4738320.1 ion transporter [Noviherbaspirillum pedocola]
MDLRLDPLPPATSNPARQYGRPEHPGLRADLYRIIFESDTRAGRLFDLVLIALILVSVTVVVLDSVQALSVRHGEIFDVLEWSFTLIFTVEYLLRLYCVRRPLAYATSFFGIIDFLSVVPTYLAMLMPGAHLLLDVRILRLLRIFRILKLTSYVDEYRMLGRALVAARRKILIFLSVVFMVVLLLATVMYAVEGPANGFTSIPTALYWAITAVTTVGFGDIVPKTDLGRAISSVTMLLGWGILAVPTGIISSEIAAQRSLPSADRRCAACGSDGHAPDARYCKDCGARLEAAAEE